MQATSAKKFSLRENVRLRILKDVLSKIRTEFVHVPNFIMVVDPMTTRIISSCAKMIELLEEGVVAIERLDLVRKPFPDMHAIYFISPVEESIDKVINDFSQKPSQYAFCHLFFTNKVDDHLVDKLSKKKSVAEKILSFKQINLDFLCPEENIFHFDMPDALSTIFSKKGSPVEIMEERIAYKLASVVPTLFDYEKFQIIYNKNPNNQVSERIAKILKTRIEKFVEIRNKEDDDEPPAPVKIVILDRSYDPLTPLLHDYYYMTLVHDLLDVKQDTVEYTSEDNSGKVINKKAVLSESDDIWMRFKYRHIAEAMTKVSEEFNQFVANNKGASFQKNKGQDLDLKQMGEIVKQMPLYRELLGKYTLHMNLIEKCLGVFQDKDLKELGEVEQCLATGIDKNGEAVKSQKLIAMIATRIAQGKLDNADKVRLMMTASVALDLSEGDRKALIQSLPENDKQTLAKLVHLGIDPSKVAKKGGSGNSLKNISEAARNRLKNMSFDLCRYQPPLEQLANDVIANKVDSNKYGSFFIPSTYNGDIGQRSKVTAGSASLKRNNNRGNANWNENMDERNQPKFIFFIIGGLSYTEIRVLHDIETSNAYLNVISGSTTIVNPAEFIQGIASMVNP